MAATNDKFDEAYEIRKDNSVYIRIQCKSRGCKFLAELDVDKKGVVFYKRNKYISHCPKAHTIVSN